MQKRNRKLFWLLYQTSDSNINTIVHHLNMLFCSYIMLIIFSWSHSLWIMWAGEYCVSCSCIFESDEGSNRNCGPWFAGITVPTAPDWNEENMLSINILLRMTKKWLHSKLIGGIRPVVSDGYQSISGPSTAESDYKMSTFWLILNQKWM